MDLQNRRKQTCARKIQVVKVITKNQLKTAQVLCKAICKLRAMGRCEFRCQKEATDGHHVFFGRQWRVHWQLLVNENYYIALCHHHHLYDKWSPHQNPEHFWGMLREERTQEVARKTLCRIPPDRVAVILCQQERLFRQDFLSDRECDGDAELLRLNEEFKRQQNIYEIDINAIQTQE